MQEAMWQRLWASSLQCNVLYWTLRGRITFAINFHTCKHLLKAEETFRFAKKRGSDVIAASLCELFQVTLALNWIKTYYS